MDGMEFKGKVALVTGGNSGIGEAAAKAFLAAGAKVGVLGRDEDEVKEAVRKMGSTDDNALALIADISSPEQMKTAYDQLIEKWGRLDVVFANAGINGVWTPLEELEPEEWDKTLNINLKGTYLTVKYAIPHMKERGGAMVVTSSVNGTRMFSNTGASAYATSKAGQVAFTKMVSLELAKYHIRINVICPGAIETNIEQNTEKRDVEKVKTEVQFPEGAIPLTKGASGSSEQVADLVLFLASEKASHITGTEIWIDGGQSLLQG
jgi:NAD(P)-dependent dehydrogenase (short-subunit alcohol dehydrogenase family)